MHAVTALTMNERNRGPLRLREMVFAPTCEREDDRKQAMSLHGQSVLIANGAILVGRLGKDAVLDQTRQTIRQHIARGAQTALEMVKSPDAKESVAQNLQHPSVPYDGEGMFQSARR